MKDINIEDFFISPETKISEALARLDETGVGIVLVVSEERHLLGTLVDGDIRRGLLKGIGLEEPVGRVMNKNPMVSTVQATRQEVMNLMKKRGIRHVPLLNEKGEVVQLQWMDDLFRDTLHDETLVVIMAGGVGSRLHPLTRTKPKGMLPVGKHPILEAILKDLTHHGFKRIVLAVHYKAESIKEYFKDGKKWGVSIEYLQEEKKLGTAGSLRLLRVPGDAPILVMNGDLLTKIDYRLLLHFHRKEEFELTVGIKSSDFQVPYGIVRLHGKEILGIEEKPVQRFFVNAGIYVVNPEIIELIPEDRTFDMTELIQKAVDHNAKVGGFPLHEYWLDIGSKQDYEKAKTETAKVFV